MKNLHFLLWAILFPLFMGACSSDELNNTIVQEGNEISKIEAVLTPFDVGETESRTAFNFGSTSVDTPVWAEGDIIGIYPSAGGDQLSFPIIDGVGTKTCVFTGGGWALKASTATETYTYTAYSPFNRNYYMLKDNTALPISMLGQKQTDNNNSSHLGAYHIQIANGDTPTSGKISFKFKHKVAFVRMDIVAPCATTWKSITLESNATFTTQATMNLSLDVPTITPTVQPSSVTLELENVKTTANDLAIVAYMAMLPIDFTDKTLTMKLTDADDNVYTAPVSIENPRNVETPQVFNAGAARWIKAEFTAEVKPTETTVRLETAGTLLSLLGTSTYSISSLKIVGPINGNDIYTLRKMLGYGTTQVGILEHLDLSEASIVSGGSEYYMDSSTTNFLTSDNEIGIYMFKECPNLRTIHLPENIIKIGYESFSGCSNLTRINFPTALKEIGYRAFYYCSNLNEVLLNTNLETIDASAFESCEKLTKIEIPSSVTYVGTGVFDHCNALSEVYISNLQPLLQTYNGGGSFFRYGKGKLYINNELITELTIPIPDNQTHLHPFFNGCSSIKKIIIPEGVTEIYDAAFKDCENLSEISLPHSLTTLGKETFTGCINLTNITIPDNVTTIESSTFYGCSKLTDITLGNKVTEIGENAFYDAPISCFYSKATTPPRISLYYDGPTFNTNCVNENAILYVPIGSAAAYMESTWKNVFKYILEK